MKKDFANIIILFVGLTIAVILVSSVVLPTVFAPTIRASQTNTNGTDVPVNGSVNIATQFTTLHMTNPTTLSSGSIVVTAQLRGNDYINVTNKNGAVLGTVLTSPTTIGLSGSLMTSTLLLNYTGNNSLAVVGGAGNITNVVLTYYQPASSDDWDAGTIAIWMVLGLAVVAALLLMVFKGRS